MTACLPMQHALHCSHSNLGTRDLDTQFESVFVKKCCFTYGTIVVHFKSLLIFSISFVTIFEGINRFLLRTRLYLNDEIRASNYFKTIFASFEGRSILCLILCDFIFCWSFCFFYFTLRFFYWFYRLISEFFSSSLKAWRLWDSTKKTTKAESAWKIRS